jgi:hypothetical protein
VAGQHARPHQHLHLRAQVHLCICTSSALGSVSAIASEPESARASKSASSCVTSDSDTDCHESGSNASCTILAVAAAAAARCERRRVACVLRAPALRACGCEDSIALPEKPAAAAPSASPSTTAPLCEIFFCDCTAAPHAVTAIAVGGICVVPRIAVAITTSIIRHNCSAARMQLLELAQGLFVVYTPAAARSLRAF